MRAKRKTALKLLSDLLWHEGEKPLRYLWIAKNRWPEQFGWCWRMVHLAEWQKSTAQSIAIWLVATPIVFHAARQLGNGVAASVGVSLAVDWLVFGLNKLWIWRKRQADVPLSAAKNLAFWAATAGINILMAWLIIGKVGLVQGRVILGAYGCLMNPVTFTVRDRVVFADTNIREMAAARYRLEMCKAHAAGHMMWRTGRV